MRKNLLLKLLVLCLFCIFLLIAFSCDNASGSRNIRASIPNWLIGTWKESGTSSSEYIIFSSNEITVSDGYQTINFFESFRNNVSIYPEIDVTQYQSSSDNNYNCRIVLKLDEDIIEDFSISAIKLSSNGMKLSINIYIYGESPIQESGIFVKVN